MTTRNLLNTIKSLATISALAVGLAAVCSAPASAQDIQPTDKMLIFNVGGAIGRMADFSVPNAQLFVYPTNSSQPRQQWTITRDTFGFKIASVTDPNEVLSPIANNYWDGAPIDEVRDPSWRNASRWQLVRVGNLPFYQIRNAWNTTVCVSNFLQNYMPVHLSACNQNDSQQWYTLMTSKGALK